jgi:Outer membrane protein and related peptidoglycan-associated (lipo)proteins
MRFNELSKLILLATITSLVAAGCSTAGKNKRPTNNHGGGDYDYDMVNPDDIGGTWMPGDLPLGGERFEDFTRLTDAETGVFSPVYFAYNAHNIPAHELGKIRAVSDFLSNNPGIVLIVEGHCDERGTSEYNITLGEYRAQNVREQLIAQGIQAANIQTSSFGEEKPVDFSHNESGWSKNRRAEFAFYRR